MNLPATGKWLAALAAGALIATTAQAKIVGKNVEYKYEGMTMKGYLAYDDAARGARPGVLVVHEWWGLNDYIKERTRQVAALGYVAFAPDMYGEGKTTNDPKVAGQWSGEVQKSGQLASRAKAGLDVLVAQPGVEKDDLGAMGFCFGGSTVLALAYSGEKLRAVATFHGGLFPPDEQQRTRIRTPILIMQGEKDPFVKPETIQQVKDALDAGHVDWYMVTYADAVHAFTNPKADDYHIPGVAYNEKAAKRSWAEMEHFFRVQLGR
ncbi:MAG TPA: dienelactone hydrolase family protein [Usitatibacter sp.]|nr:dienelactone hydrolase family protein [Usitatibacter sp.]